MFAGSHLDLRTGRPRRVLRSSNARKNQLNYLNLGCSAALNGTATAHRGSTAGRRSAPTHCVYLMNIWAAFRD